MATKRATHFFDSTRLGCKCHLDEDEWVGIIQAENWVVYLFLQVWASKGDPILHIEVYIIEVFSKVFFRLKCHYPQLRRWADVFVIAPLGANTMAKMTNGLCDNLLVSFIQAMCNVLEYSALMHRNSKLWFIENYQRVPFYSRRAKCDLRMFFCVCRLV